MTPSSAFMQFSSYILSPKHTGVRNAEQWTDFAIDHVSGDVRRLATAFIEQKLNGSDRDLSEMWARSNAEMGPDSATARPYTELVLQRLRNPSIPDGRDVPEVEPGP